MKNGSSDFKGVFYILDLGDIEQEGEYRRWILIVDCFKGDM
jgi:hypothetical protein